MAERIKPMTHSFIIHSTNLYGAATLYIGDDRARMLAFAVKDVPLAVGKKIQPVRWFCG